MSIDLSQKIYVAGHRGMVGSAIVRNLQAKGFQNIVTRTHSELDLTNQAAVKAFFELERPCQVYLAAAKVGGIYANNTYPAEFIYQNLMIEANIIHQAFETGVKKMLFLGSSCIYPKLSPQPMMEDALLTGNLEETNEPYAIAKIAGIKLCESYNRQYGKSHQIDYRSIMPTNLYGPGDNYHQDNSHVIPGLIRRFHDAKKKGLGVVKVWGTGIAKREFLAADDLAEAAVFIMALKAKKYYSVVREMQSHLNVGSGQEITIKDLALLIAKVVEFNGKIEFDPTYSDGAPRKLLDSKKIRQLGWQPKIKLECGLVEAYLAFKELRFQDS
ncbi:GDP-L-fucose synthase [Polynucleobacter sp. Nonnen-W13]|uniref:GDP-L-fucose synthase family protein n=1 Tax=Polynucleobacter sp. Nonnen-W13 TaxID=1855625 RepID=UPI001C0DAAC4|nr:GDP-L-fucose synthase [Polynucleobacter sp. Nonnen-W13]MBU3558351.1 GDP-L-fucose synthase [Polynucleobacter sp. Nonnen-W13]